MNLLLPIEEKALLQFASKDEALPFINGYWHYRVPNGHAFMATDGHTLALLLFGDARKMKPTEFDVYAGRGPAYVRQAPRSFGHDEKPPRWGRQVAEVEKNLLPEHVPAKRLSFEASYLARLGMVEKAAVARAKTQLPKGLDKFEKSRWLQANLAGCFVTMVPGAEEEGGRPLGLYWSASSDHATWKGVIMPRKL